MTTDLSVLFCDFQLKNPVILASGILGTSASLLERVARLGAGGVTSKSCSPQPRAGHPNPTVLDWGHGYLNAVGLANPGVEKQMSILRDAKRRLTPLGTALIASIFAETVDDFARMAEQVSRAEPDFIEVNISCPNVGHEFGRPFSAEAESAAAVTRAVKGATGIPAIVKLSPNVTDIGEIARAVEAAGADAIAAINTLTGMLIDIRAARPILSNLKGGISGPALKPVAVRCIYECYKAVSIPILGIGGVMTGEDAVELIMAGATAVGVGSATHTRGPQVLGEIVREMQTFMAAEGYETVGEMRGAAHRLTETEDIAGAMVREHRR